MSYTSMCARQLENLLEDCRRCEETASELDELYDQTKDIRSYLLELKIISARLSDNVKKYRHFTERLAENKVDIASYRTMFFLYYEYYNIFRNLIEGIENNNLGFLKDSIIHALYDGPKDLTELEQLTAFSKHSVDIGLHELEQYIDSCHEMKKNPRSVYTLKPIWKSIYQIIPDPIVSE